MLLSALLLYMFSLAVTDAIYTCTYRINSQAEPDDVPDDGTPGVTIQHPRGVLTSALFDNIPLLAQCTTLRFHNVGIAVIERGAWLGLEKLERLELRENELTALTIGAFENLRSLEHLNLTANKISSIDLEAFSNLTSLTELYLSKNSISILQRDMFMDLTNLESLILDRNQIWLIEDGAFNGLHLLNMLGLENNNLSSSIFTPVNVLENITDTLTNLCLQGNHFHTIYNDMFSRFTVLEHLSVTTMNIEQPNGFSGLDSLKDLWVTGIQMVDMGSDSWSQIGDTLTNLQLQLESGESLKEDMFERTPLLTYLSLEKNNITIIHPTTFNGLNFLEHLSLQNNNISEEEIRNLQNVRSTLVRLELSYNRIAAIPKDTFNGFTSLKYLLLSNNGIALLVLDGFSGLQSLTDLDLSQNAISAVEPGSFEGLSSLRKLYLTNNLFTTLEWTAFSLNCAPQSGHLILGIADNRIVCDERIKWIKDGEQEGWLSFFLDPPTCQNFPHTTWQNVTIPEFHGFNCSGHNSWCCTDVIECEATSDICSDLTSCVNTIGSYHCSFPSGYGVNECDLGLDICSEFARCEDTIASYTCSCKPGFSGNGFECINIDECQLGLDICSDNATCEDNFGSYGCSCNVGFYGDGLLCVNINECDLGLDKCSENEKCKDTIGSYKCSCKPGSRQFLGIRYTTIDGHSASVTEVNECIGPCAIGHYVNEATKGCKQCKDGTYQPLVSQEFCEQCPVTKKTTGGSGAIRRDQCVSHEKKQVLFSITLDEEFDERLSDASSDYYVVRKESIENLMKAELSETRYFVSISLTRFRSGSIIAEMEAVLLKHPDAECIMYNRIHNIFPSVNIKDHSCTMVTLHGSNLQIGEPHEIKIGTTACVLVSLNDRKMVCLAQPVDDSQLTEQKVFVNWTTAERDTGFTFTYKPNAEIHGILANVNPLRGGIPITVNGRNMDSVAEPVIVMTVRTNSGTSVFYQACNVISDSQIVCFTPSIAKIPSSGPYVNNDCGPEMKYHTLTNKLAYDINDPPSAKDVTATVTFLMDSAELTNEPFTLKVVEDPVIMSSLGGMVTFSTQFPCQKDLIDIEGEHLMDLSTDMFKVTVGDELCTDMHVTESKITCKPPAKKPNSGTTVKVHIGCHSHVVYTLKYKGFLDCEKTMYILVPCGVAVVGIVVIIGVCCRIRRTHRKRNKNGLDQQMPMSVFGKMPETQRYVAPKTTAPSEHPYPQHNVYQEFNAPSVAAPSEASYLHPYSYPKSTSTSIYEYPATGPNDYASIPAYSEYQPQYEGHGHVYQGTVPTYTRPTRGGDSTSQINYAASTYGNPNAPVYSAPSHVKSIRNGPSHSPKVPESVATYATISNFKDKGGSAGVQMREKKGEKKSTLRRFSGRFSPGAMTEDRNYPQAAKAPSKRLSHWFSSDGTGPKMFRAFRQPWARHN